MPRIDEATIAKKPFKKKAYRPWNLMDDEFSEDIKIEQPKSPSELVTIKEPIGNQLEVVNNPISNHMVTNEGHLEINKEPIGSHIDNHISNQIIEKTSDIPVNHHHMDIGIEIQRLYGIQKKLFLNIVEDCILNGSLFTSPISTEIQTTIVNANKDTVKTAVQRLINKQLITRAKGKRGRGGFAIFSITADIKNYIIDGKRRGLYNSELVTNQLSNKEPIITYSSSSNILNTTTTNANEEWSFDITSFSKIGFTSIQLKQLIALGTLNPVEVEQALIEFTFDFENNALPKNIRTSNINFLMGLLRRGTMYISQDYRTEQQRIDAEMAQRAEERKRKILEEKFIAWEVSLTNEDRKKIEQEVPPGLRSFYSTEGIRYPQIKEFMLNYFLRNSL